MKGWQNGNRKRGLVYIAVFALFTNLTGCSFLSEAYYGGGAAVLEDVAKPAMNSNVQNTPSWYFFHEDRLYVYDFTSGKDVLFSLDLKGKDKEVLAVSSGLHFADFMMVHEGEAYFHSENYRGVKKVNLSTGEITMLVEGEYYYLMADTLKDGKVRVNYTNNYVNKAHTKVAVLDLKTGELSSEKQVKFCGCTYFWDTEGDKVYYLDSQGGQNMVYEDCNVIYTYEANNSLSEPDGNFADLVFVQDGYIYVIIGNKVVKLDGSDYSVLEEKTIDRKYSLVSGVRPGGATMLGVEEGPAVISLYPLFTTGESGNDGNDSLYCFNTDTLSFETLIDGVFPGGFVQRHGDCYVFQTKTETTIYNCATGAYQVYDSANHTVEGDSVYLMAYTGDFWRQWDVPTFEIKKIPLNSK